MDGQDLLSIREFATVANVTTQSIYKRIKAEGDPLRAYIVEEPGGKKKLHKDGLQLFATDYQPIDNHIDNQLPTNYQPIIDSKQEMIDTLKAELEAKNRLLESIQEAHAEQLQAMREDYKAQLEAKDRQIDTLTQAVAAAAFHAGQLQGRLTDHAQSEGAASSDTDTDTQSDTQTEPVKRSFWDRINPFKKK